MTPFDLYMRKRADVQPTSFESNQIPNIDTQGSVVDSRSAPRHASPELENASTSADDEPIIAEPRSPGSADGGGCESL